MVGADAAARVVAADRPTGDTNADADTDASIRSKMAVYGCFILAIFPIKVQGTGARYLEYSRLKIMKSKYTWYLRLILRFE